MKKIIMLIIILFLTIISIPLSLGKYKKSFKSSIIINSRKPVYTIKFNANTGMGDMDDMVLEYGEVKNLNINKYIKDKYTFIGWNTKKDGTGYSYYDNEEVYDLTHIDNDIIELYAQWASNYIYFQLPPDWNGSGVNVYLYNDIKQIYNASWPGKRAFIVDSNKKIYRYQVDSENINNYTNVIFTDTSANNKDATRQTIDLKFTKNNLGKIFVPKLYSNLNKIRIFTKNDKSIGPLIYLWKRVGNNDTTDMNWQTKPYITKRISGYGYEYIIDLKKYNMFNLSFKGVTTDDIYVPIYQDLTYKITENNTHEVSRYYYDGLWYEYDDWINTKYDFWKNDDYIKFLQVPKNYY